MQLFVSFFHYVIIPYLILSGSSFPEEKKRDPTASILLICVSLHVVSEGGEVL